MVEGSIEKRSFYRSCGLHLGVLLVLLMIWIANQLESAKEPEPFVFQLVAPPTPEAQQDPRIEPETMAPVIRPSRPPEPPPPPTPPEVKPEVIPEPVAPPPPPRLVEDAPPRQPPVERISFEDFVKKEGQPKPRQPTQTPRRQVEEISIRTDFLKDLDQMMAPTERAQVELMTPAMQRAIDTYLGRVRSRALASWVQPTGVRQGAVVTVVFSLTSSGHLASLWVVRSSGNAALDRSALDAIRSASPYGPNPSGEPLGNLRISFEIK